MYKKRLVLMALATATSMNSFANVGELPGPGEMPTSISASMSSEQRMEYRQKRMDAYQRLYSTFSSSYLASSVFKDLESMTYIDLSTSTQAFIDAYTQYGSSDTVTKIFRYIDQGLSRKTEEQFLSQLKNVNKMYSALGSVSRSLSMMDMAREVVSEGKADSINAVVKHIVTVYTLTGRIDRTEMLIREAAEMNLTADGTTSSIDVGIKLYSVTGAVASTVEMMKLIRKAYTAQLLSSYKEGASQLEEIFRLNGMAPRTIEIYDRFVNAAKSPAELKDLSLTYNSLYTTTGYTSTALDLLEQSRDVFNKRLTTSIKDASVFASVVYTRNGSSEGTRELISFLADRCGDANEFQGGIKMYLQALHTQGSHTRAMQALKSFW